MIDFRFWPFASFRGNAALRSLSERSGHQLVGKTRGIGRELTHVRSRVCIAALEKMAINAAG
jgi:hypothetical protein